MDHHSYHTLRARIGNDHLALRMRRQTDHVALRMRGGTREFYLENLEILPVALRTGLRLTGMLGRATRNTIKFRVEHHTVKLADLPPGFDGYRILHLSDLHIDGLPDKGASLCQLVSGLDYDLCVITGDYRFLTHGDYLPALEAMAPLAAAVRCPGGVLGILGNHDVIEMVPDLEDMGIRMLLNEAVPVTRNGDSLWIAGIDDPHYYHAHDIDKAMQGIPENTTTVLLAHSPEVMAMAEQAGASLYLCGHSHGGQVCLPGGIPVICNTRSKRRYVAGIWAHGPMRGYTSRGAGSSGLAARLFCPPEVAIHTLSCG